MWGFFNFKKDDHLLTISKLITSEEKILWQTEYRILGSKVLIAVTFQVLFLLLLSSLGIVVAVYENFFQNLNIFIIILLILIIFIFSMEIYYTINRTLNLLYAFCITDKKLIFITAPVFEQIYPTCFFSNLADVESIEATSEKNDNYTKYKIKSYFNYFNYFNYFKLFKTSSFFYLDEKGLEILIKILKEKAPNCKINLLKK